MSLRYSGVKSQVAGRVQLASLAVLFNTLARAARAKFPDGNIQWLAESIPWADLERFRPSAEDVASLLQSSGPRPNLALTIVISTVPS